MKKLDEHQIRLLFGQAIACKDDDETANEVSMDRPIGQIYDIDETDLDYVQKHAAALVDGHQACVPCPNMQETPRAYLARVNSALTDAGKFKQQAEKKMHEAQERLAKLEQRDKLEAELRAVERKRELDELAYRGSQQQTLDKMQSLSANLRKLNEELGLEDR